jgi:UDP-N-acetylglucosamine--N-acetylmuramyl-(pentapeptide) pyrophosphoryl-undecaprenol N-acetylglucosamine transferase
MSAETTRKRIMFSGGGTAGHVNPGLAIVDELRRRLSPGNSWTCGSGDNLKQCVMWVGSERMESQLVPQAGGSFRQIDIRFSYRRLTPANWGYYQRHILPILLGHPFRQALATLDIFQPNLVVGTGGYVAAPVLWAAQYRNVPYALLQCDQPPGMVNSFFADKAWRVFAATDAVARAFEGHCALEKVRVTGFPVQVAKRTREDFCREMGIDPAKWLLVAMGGSLGAGAVHHAIAELLRAAAQAPDERWKKLAVLNIGGSRDDLAAITEGSARQGGTISYHHVGYLDHAIDALHAADFYLGRSGAATVGELIATGVPSLLIPDPQHADRQQYANADVLVARGQGSIIEQREVTGSRLLEWLKRAWEQPRHAALATSAAENVAREISQLWESE